MLVTGVQKHCNARPRGSLPGANPAACPACHRQERVEPVQQQFSYSRLAKVLNATSQPPLEEVRGIWRVVQRQVLPAGIGQCGCLRSWVSRDYLECSSLCLSNKKNPAIADGIKYFYKRISSTTMAASTASTVVFLILKTPTSVVKMTLFRSLEVLISRFS